MALFNFRRFLRRKELKSVPAIGVFTQETREGIHRAYMPQFLYKPPFGYPRYLDIPNLRRLAATPFVDMCITTIVDEVCSIKWDIVPKDEEEGAVDSHIQHVKALFENPNTNKESFEKIHRRVIRDILEVDAGIINKVFNRKGELVELVAKDGGTFTKNPDPYGMFTNRDDIILQKEVMLPDEGTGRIGELYMPKPLALSLIHI